MFPPHDLLSMRVAKWGQEIFGFMDKFEMEKEISFLKWAITNGRRYRLEQNMYYNNSFNVYIEKLNIACSCFFSSEGGGIEKSN